MTEPADPEPEEAEEASSGEMLFYMESQLEDFLIENWDHTDIGQRCDLIKNENDELVSQQYKTGIGYIDILAKDKATGRYVVIELKKNQTSDDTIGQIARYMGWVDEHLGGNKKSMGVIIAAHFNKRLYYASKRLSDVELYEYKVDFRLEAII